MINTVIIPDVHGRTFWKDTIPYIEEGYRTVFLGDYLDPYPFETSTQSRRIDDKYFEECIDNFKEIIELKKCNGNVTLLLGNHDSGYMFDTYVCDCRTIYDYFSEIRNIFHENKDFFDLAMYQEINNKPIIFSHAGISKDWWSIAYEEITGNKLPVDFWNKDDCDLDIVLDINRFYHNAEVDSKEWGSLIKILGMVGRSRGGWDSCPSMIWADISDWYKKNTLKSSQVVGHTLQLDVKYKDPKNHMAGWTYVDGYPKTNQNVLCVDCRQPFYIIDGVLTSSKELDD